MSDRSRGDGWWQAADGKWYPPELLDAPRQQWPTTELTPVVPGAAETNVPVGSGAQVAIGVSSIAMAGAGFAGFVYAAAIRDAGDGWETRTSALNGELFWTSLYLLGWLAVIAAGIALMVWSFRTSKAMDRRGAENRRWSPGWAIGAWFIPLANLVVPRLVFGELERCAGEPYRGAPIGTAWKSRSRFTVGDVWWFLWIAGYGLSSFGNLAVDPATTSAGRFATFLTVGSFGSLVLALAGVALILEIRALVDASQR